MAMTDRIPLSVTSVHQRFESHATGHENMRASADSRCIGVCDCGRQRIKLSIKEMSGSRFI